MDGIVDIAVEGARLIRKLTEEEVAKSGMNIRYEYSPESFTGTEIDFPSAFAKKLCVNLAQPKKPGYFKPAFNGRNVHTKHLCRPD